MMVVVVIVVVIAVAIVVPGMVMFDATMRPIPIAFVELAVMTMRPDPVCTGIRGTRPVARMPDVMAIDGIPVSSYPNEIWPRADWPMFDSDSRRRTYPDAKRDLCLGH